MILSSERVTQRVDRHVVATFVKEILSVRGQATLSIVRKRLPPESLPNGYRAPLILAHGFGQNRYAWHLPSRSFANHLALAGFDVFNVDLRGHGRSKGRDARRSHSADEYLTEDMPSILNAVLRASDRSTAFLLGHSLGGLLACALAARERASVAGVVALGVPYEFARGNLALACVATGVRMLAASRMRAIDRARIPVRAVGRLLRATAAAWDSHLVPLPVRVWHPGALEPTLLDEYLTRAFDSASLGSLAQISRIAFGGSFRSANGALDYAAAFEAADVPLLVVAGTHDRLAPPESVRPAFERSRSPDKTYYQFDAGHADLLLGSAAPTSTWPAVTKWLLSRT